MRTTNVKRFLKWLWLLGVVVWLMVVSLLLWRLSKAESFAQASFYETRLTYASMCAIFWGIAPAVWQARLKKTRASRI
jgi:hypothetical protein